MLTKSRTRGGVSSADYSSNCENMSSAVRPYAVDWKMVTPVLGKGDLDTVRIRNTNMSKLIHATFPAVDGEASASGDFSIDGVSGTGARLQFNFINPAGCKIGKLLPTESAVDDLDGVRATLIDAANPCCLVLASGLGVKGTASPEEADANKELLARLEKIRRLAAVKMGLAKTVRAYACGYAPPHYQSKRWFSDSTTRCQCRKPPLYSIPLHAERVFLGRREG